MISTTADASIVRSMKPRVVEDYNNLMYCVNQSDHMAACTPSVRKTTRCYIRIFSHIITQTTLVNAWMFHNKTKTKLKVNYLKVLLIKSSLENQIHKVAKKSPQMEKVPGRKAITRKRCVGCYNENGSPKGRTYVSTFTRKVSTSCSKCYTNLCLECFQLCHKKCDQ